MQPEPNRPPAARSPAYRPACLAVALLSALAAVVAGVTPAQAAPDAPAATTCVNVNGRTVCLPCDPATLPSSITECCSNLTPAIACGGIDCTQPLDQVCCLLQPQGCTVGCDLGDPLSCCAGLGIVCPDPGCDLLGTCCEPFALPAPIMAAECCPTDPPTQPPCEPPRPCEPTIEHCPVSVGCRSDAIIVDEADLLGGSSHNVFSESRAEMSAAVPGTYAPPPALNPLASSPPRPYGMAHADAQQVGVSYSNLLVGVRASEVHSRCDVDLVDDALKGGVFSDAYGKAGIEDLTLTVPLAGLTLDLEALDLEMLALGTPFSASATWTCDLADLELNAAPVVAVCAPSLVVPGVVVTVYYNQINPVSYDAATNRWVYSGSHIHVNVNALVATTDVYIGYVEVGVPASAPGPVPALPVPAYVPHVGCLLCT